MAGRQPEYVVKARTGRKDGDDKDILMQCGVGWSFRTADFGISVQVNALPVPFDGSLLVFRAKDDDR